MYNHREGGRASHDEKQQGSQLLPSALQPHQPEIASILVAGHLLPKNLLQHLHPTANLAPGTSPSDTGLKLCLQNAGMPKKSVPAAPHIDMGLLTFVSYDVVFLELPKNISPSSADGGEGKDQSHGVDPRRAQRGLAYSSTWETPFRPRPSLQGGADSTLHRTQQNIHHPPSQPQHICHRPNIITMADQPYVEVYKKTAQNSVLRCPSRGAYHQPSTCHDHHTDAIAHAARYDVHTVHSIINSAPLAHVGFINPETLTPVVLPMIARIGDYEADQDCASGSNQGNVSESCQGKISESCQGNVSGNGHTTPNGDAMDTAEDTVEDTVACYLHGSAAARLFRDGNGMGNGIPVCIEATKILGLVLTLTPFSHTYDYRSAILHGRATLLDPANSLADRAEVLWALKLLTDGILPERWANCRTPPDEFELMSTRIIKVRIESASAKVRNHGVDEQPKDLKPTERANIMRTWTGVIPHLDLLGEPQPARFNMVRHPPSYITDHVKRHNEEEIAHSRLAHRLWDVLSWLIPGTWAWLFGR
ncbi:hypothetical protein PG996_011203 [Apiospora saccharicola]|uniref:Uncharacterized protein n=1 Tax=Apiospora saccharicola TaxID=335842 RepID=A0ABR1UEG4_9PEZI